jgi:hypothetical protein
MPAIANAQFGGSSRGRWFREPGNEYWALLAAGSRHIVRSREGASDERRYLRRGGGE